MTDQLQDLKLEWQLLREKLENDPRFRGTLAGLFWPWVPQSYSESNKGILYIGKATAGPVFEPNLSELYFNCNHGGFWSLANRLSKSIDTNASELSNLIWSNLYKIGTVSGNPKDDLAKLEHDLAVRTLRAEISAFRPSIVVCVAANWHDEVLYDVLGVKNADSFLEDRVDRCLYRRPACDGFPPVLWLDHPQGKSERYWTKAEELAVALTR